MLILTLSPNFIFLRGGVYGFVWFLLSVAKQREETEVS